MANYCPILIGTCMLTTTNQLNFPTLTQGGDTNQRRPEELLANYRSLISEQRLNWTEHLRLLRPLGSGGQGVVYLSERRGTDGFTLPVAVKVFSPERFSDARSYDDAMARMARIAARVAQIQQDNLLDVHNFVDRSRIRIMEMEWVDGYDLSRLLTFEMLERAQQRVSQKRWEYLNNVIVTAGPAQPRLKPGIAVAILRDCLAALAALHREQIVHGDIKPSNVMLKRTGNAKIVDIGAAFLLEEPPTRKTCTPVYAAPEVLEGADATPLSDLCSLGYVVVEMLAGQSPFTGMTAYRDLLEAKRMLVHRLPQLVPRDAASSELLMNLLRGLVAADPVRRFPSAETADLVKEGAAGFQRQLIKGDLASEYGHEIRVWLEELE